MAKADLKGSTKKNSQLVLRLDKDERDAFVALCRDLDTSAAREIRKFIRAFMAENAGT
ncbi:MULTISPECIES: hypothetical protein [Ruegeria]|uniref:hypothetical protein n=1 Tax=Ruegeria TaxID=97050 RepID=UPI001C94C1C8|nr:MULTISPECIES: hypothetical protein [Ruegeria]MBY6081942.1 hypothetical protein [Ruegeria arenilitoris]UWR06424.1 hypothetical protein K3752_12285 [Ruegeria sp. B32]